MKIIIKDKKDIIRNYFESRYKKKLSSQEIAEIKNNLVNFFEILLRIDNKPKPKK